MIIRILRIKKAALKRPLFMTGNYTLFLHLFTICIQLHNLIAQLLQPG